MSKASATTSWLAKILLSLKLAVTSRRTIHFLNLRWEESKYVDVLLFAWRFHWRAHVSIAYRVMPVGLDVSAGPTIGNSQQASAVSQDFPNRGVSLLQSEEGLAANVVNRWCWQIAETTVISQNS